MSRTHFESAIENLKKKLLAVTALVEQSVVSAIKVVEEGDAEQAKSVKEYDDKIDFMEVEVEEECLKLLALYQPVSSDLRFIISTLKINNDLERIGDLANSIAARVIDLDKLPKVKTPFDIHSMSVKVLKMVRDSISSLINLDINLAKSVMSADEHVDAIHADNYSLITEKIIQNPENAKTLIIYTSLSRYMERIADLTTNIAEDVIYLIEGNIIRHRRI